MSGERARIDPPQQRAAVGHQAAVRTVSVSGLDRREVATPLVFPEAHDTVALEVRDQAGDGQIGVDAEKAADRPTGLNRVGAAADCGASDILPPSVVQNICCSWSTRPVLAGRIRDKK